MHLSALLQFALTALLESKYQYIFHEINFFRSYHSLKCPPSIMLYSTLAYYAFIMLAF